MAEACVTASTADNQHLGFETTSGYVGDGKAAGDEISGMVSREAVTDAGVYTIQVAYP